jgi:heat shock protein HtpX
LASALIKISGDPDPLDEATKGTAHLYIVNPMAAHNKSGLNSLFSTHPPIEDRIARLRAMMGIAMPEREQA